MYDYDVAFLGGVFPKEHEEEIISNSKRYIQNAANLLQWNIISGLDENLGMPVKIINSVYIGAFPILYKKLFIKTYKFSHKENAEDINVGFCNLKGYKYLSRKIHLRPILKKWALQNSGKKKVIIGYALTDTIIKSLLYVKRINNAVTTCIIVPDLPQYMNTSNKESLIRSIFKKYDIKNIEKKLALIDDYVLLTKQMNEYIKSERFTVVEGVASKAVPKSFDDFSKDERIILYCGALNERYGIKNLVDSFMEIKERNYKLVICGQGDSKDYIKKCAEKNPSIIFKGLISHDEVSVLQKQASVVVNPRQNCEEFTKFSFPSKNLEYLSSGTPLIAYKLDGIPDEYDGYIYYVDDNSDEALKNKIIEVCEKSNEELFDFGQKAYDFVQSHKNSKVQAKKILDLVEEEQNE